MNYYSFVMGISDSILQLRELNFTIEKFGLNYGITFSKDNATVWENFISNNMKNGYWNEYLGDDIVFLFKHMNGKIEKYTLNADNESHILKLCSKFADCEFKSIKDMLQGNSFYNEKYFSVNQ